MQPGVSVVILTKDEEENLPQALDSVTGWARRVFVFDSFSTDRTVEIARARGAEVLQHKFEDYGKQRNAALDQLPIDTEWVFFLDADEWLPSELKEEISALIARNPPENGFFVNRRLLWMGRWIKRGYYPVWILRLFRHGKGRCEERSVNEHMVVEGTVGRLQNDFMHEDRKSVGEWIAKHNGYATKEARELLRAAGAAQIPARLFGPQAERVRWIRQNVWNRLPPLARPFAYFGYRYFARRGFLDGKEALAFHVLQGLWYPLLIDVKYLEMKARRAGRPPGDG